MSLFQHRHYAAMADALHYSTLTLQDHVREYVINAFTDSLAGTNPAFDRASFIAAALGTTRACYVGRQFSVRISYDTTGTDPADALRTALAAIETRSGFYVEVYSEASPNASEREGDASEWKDAIT